MSAAVSNDPSGSRARAALEWLSDPAVLGAALATIFALPLAALVALALSGDGSYLTHIAATRLYEFTINSALLALMAGGAAAIIGIGCAWLIARYDFAGRRVIGWLLILPLAMPSYIAAYSWYSLTAPGSDLERAIRIDLPTVSGPFGAAFIFAMTLYPYVYLLSRNAIEAHGRLSWDVARSLGAGPWQAFAKVGLPLVWPAAAAGTALVAMEVLADFGVADFLGVPTLTVGIVRAWSSFSDPAASAQLAVILLFGALVLLGAERAARGRRQFSATGSAKQSQGLTKLSGVRAAAALSACLLPVLLGLAIPVAELAWRVIETQPSRSVVPALEGTVTLAVTSGLIAVVLGLTGAYVLRNGQSLAKLMVRVVQAGYAVPGAVAAIAILSALVVFQNAMGAVTGGRLALLTGGSVVALLFAYQARFAAVAILPCETALMKIRRDLDEAARNLGASPRHVLARVHIPLAVPGIATAGLLVAIEVMKELPATMILRPFDLQTLAVSAHNYASDERLPQAALPALILLALCLPATAALNLLRPRQQ